jgi:maltose alpha-D-glucosyltransferase/alpha-amylase
VLAHRADGPTGTMVFLHNLGTEDVEVDLSTLQPEADQPIDVLSDRGYDEVGKLDRLKLAGHGYRWIRLCRSWSV